MCDGSEHKSVTWTSKKIKISVQTTHACHLGLMHWLEIGGWGEAGSGTDWQPKTSPPHLPPLGGKELLRSPRR